MADARTPQERLRDAIAAQAIESNPLTSEEISMFEMFEREGWPVEQRRAHILSKAHAIAAE